MTLWHDVLCKDRPLAVVADVRMPDLVNLLKRMHEEWGRPIEVWLTQADTVVASWAASLGIHVRTVDREPTVSVSAPGFDTPMTLTAGILESTQLVFLGHGALSTEGILLGGVYSLSCLVPHSMHPRLPDQWGLLLRELYRRFPNNLAVLPIRKGSVTHLVSGDPWALDERLLSTLPPRAGMFHASLRQLLLPPAAIDSADTLTVSADRGRVPAYPCGAWQRICCRVWEIPRNRLILVADKLQTIISFRCRKYLKRLRGAS